MPDAYVPIDCNYYDLLEIAAMRRREAEVRYTDQLGSLISTKTRIEDLWARDGEEFMRLANGVVLRLDQLVSLDGQERPGAGSCGVKL